MAQIIWTNHFKERLKERHIEVRLVDKTIRFPDQTIKSKTSNSLKHIKHFPDQTLIVIVKRKNTDWIILSVWKKPPQTKTKTDHSLFSSVINRFFPNLKKLFS